MSKLRQAFVSTLQRFSALSPIMKVVGALSAIIGLATAIVQIYSTISDQVGRREAFSSFIKVAAGQLRDGEYDASWNANAKALEIEPKNAAALGQQAQIAMLWLEDVRLSSKPGAKTFGDITDPLEDVLAQRSTFARGTELADIKAHIGWARFLKSRDGVTGLHILEEFAEALSIDRGNMYAHVMKGFFIIWKGEPVEAARADFDAALQSSTDPDFCDRMILSALTNFLTDAHRLAVVEYANKIRRRGKTINEELRNRVLWSYEEGLSDSEYLAKLSRVSPLDEQITNLDWLMKDQSADRLRNIRALRAYFMELAGQASEALALYKEVVETSAESSNRAVAFARSGMRRLSQGSSEPSSRPSSTKPAR